MALIPLRLIIGILGVWACALVYTQRSAMAVAIVAMTTPKHLNGTAEEMKPEFDWSEKLQGIILGSQFYLYIFVPSVAGHIADKWFGAKWINFLGAIVPCLLSLLTPIGVRKGGVGVLIAIRTIDGAFHGFVYASLFSLYTKWFPKHELAVANGSLFFGGSLGSTVMFALAGYACETDIGWPLVYYINATLYIPWLVLWIYFCTSDPAENRLISDKELQYIKDNIPQSSTVLRKTPWLQMFTSKPVLSSAFLKMCSGFGYFLLMTKMPAYLSSVLHIKIFQNGVFSGSITLLQGLCALLSAPLSNWIISQFNFKSMTVRKVFQSVAMLGPALCFALIPSLEGGNANVVLGLLLGSVFSYGFFTGGEWSTGSEYAKNSAGVIFGITNSLAFAMGVFAPLLVGIMLDAENAESRSQWNIIFYITSAVYAVGLIPFLLFGTNKQQAWDKALEGDAETQDSKNYEEL